MANAIQDSTDTFEDIPLDTRHHHVAQKPKFPKEWRMTPERKKELAGVWAEAKKIDDGKAKEAQLLSNERSAAAALAGPSGKTKANNEVLNKEAVAQMVRIHRSPQQVKRP